MRNARQEYPRAAECIIGPRLLAQGWHFTQIEKVANVSIQCTVERIQKCSSGRPFAIRALCTNEVIFKQPIGVEEARAEFKVKRLAADNGIAKDLDNLRRKVATVTRLLDPSPFRIAARKHRPL